MTVTFHRHTALPLVTTLTAVPALASDVPGSGVTEFLNQIALVFGILGVSGLVASALSCYLHRSVFFVPPVCAFAWMYFASHEYSRYGNMGVVLFGLIPYVLCYALGLFLFGALTKEDNQNEGN